MIAFINTFHVVSSDQQKVMDLLSKVTRELVSKAPGFISSTLHRGSDGTRVTMYARWANLDAYEAMRRDPAPKGALAELMTLAQFDVGIYEIVEEFTPAG